MSLQTLNTIAEYVSMFLIPLLPLFAAIMPDGIRKSSDETV